MTNPIASRKLLLIAMLGMPFTWQPHLHAAKPVPLEQNSVRNASAVVVPASGAAVALRKVTARVGPPEEIRALETLNMPPATRTVLNRRAVEPSKAWSRGVFNSVQVNVDSLGRNVVGDAANEPSMAIDPTNPNRIVIGWRQFDTITSDFRQAGRAYSHNGGTSWTFPGVLDPGQFRSDPVLGVDQDGNFYYSSLSALDSVEMFKSIDGGVTWFAPVNAFGGDKQWIAVDPTSGIGSGNIYQFWNVQFSCCPPNDFARSINRALSFQAPISIPWPKMKWGTASVGWDGTLYLGGAALDSSNGHLVARSTDAKNPAVSPSFDFIKAVDLGGQGIGGGVNPEGLLGQVWIATDHSEGPMRGNVYMLGSVHNPSEINLLNVKFIRSVDGGRNWSSPVRINDDRRSGGWHWFGAMSVAPNGRIDATWNDTRDDPAPFNPTFSVVYYSYSLDAGQTWSANVAVSIPFDPSLGYPVQRKMGDYTHMISDNGGANLAYSATFNGEEDVYFIRIPFDCNGNGQEDPLDIVAGTSTDCNRNVVPDECEPDEDCNATGVSDICDIGLGKSEDCNENRIPDECEAQDNCNGNGTTDVCDLFSGSSADCNGNGIPDECDIESGSSDDQNSNGVPDECQGACCLCPDSCTDTTDFECRVQGGRFGGMGQSCDEVGCPPIPSNNSCQEAVLLRGVEHQEVAIDNTCATQDGPPIVGCTNGDQPFGRDLWYQLVAPCTGLLTASMCDNADYDAIMGIYSTGDICRCPSDNLDLIECGDDSCGVGGGPPVISTPVQAGICYTIRVGGWELEGGLGALSVDLVCSGCPVGPVAFIDPPDGVVDARQPHPPLKADTRQGIDAFVLSGPRGLIKRECWSLCETTVDGTPNSISEIVDHGNGTATIHLGRTISTGAVTSLAYRDDSGVDHTGVFTSHPANVNADSSSAASDILNVIDILNEAVPAPWGLYSADVDHSGAAGAADILRVIDLLNGAAGYRVWLGDPKPECGNCCGP